MGKLIATTQATIDGVIDPVGEWVQADGDHGEYSFERQEQSKGLVLGRKTYEGLAGYWPSQTGRWADMVNAIPKYVGSTPLSGELEWNATLLEGDLEHALPKVKDEVDGDLFMHGSGEFAYALAERGLIDEYEVYLNPLVSGRGQRPCARRQGHRAHDARGRQALRLGRRPPHLPAGILTARISRRARPSSWGPVLAAVNRRVPSDEREVLPRAREVEHPADRGSAIDDAQLPAVLNGVALQVEQQTNPR